MGKESREPLYIMRSLKLRNWAEYQNDSTDCSRKHWHLILWKYDQEFVSCSVHIYRRTDSQSYLIKHFEVQQVKWKYFKRRLFIIMKTALYITFILRYCFIMTHFWGKSWCLIGTDCKLNVIWSEIKRKFLQELSLRPWISDFNSFKNYHM